MAKPADLQLGGLDAEGARIALRSSAVGETMEDLRVDFEPFIDDAVRKFVEDGVDNYNTAVTGLTTPLIFQIAPNTFVNSG
jgi:hypothetical protein